MDKLLFENSPEGRKAFEALGERVVQWISEYYASIESRPVRSQVEPGEIYQQFPDHFPEDPLSVDVVFKVIDEVIMPGITHWQHPNFHAFFPGNTSFPSIAAEMITAGIAAQCMLWESSPAAAELEQRCMEWYRELLSLPAHWQGAIQDTASTATLTALLTAREWKSGFRIAKRGFDNTVYRIYTSGQAHSSVEKAVRLAGFGTDNLISIPVDDDLSMMPAILEQTIANDISKGFVPTAVISTIGTTGTGAIDPVLAISAIASRYGLWHHVDAAYAGTVLMLEEFAHLRDGLDGADSFVFNPHKWGFVQFDCSAYYVRDPELLIRTMSITPSYLATVYGDRVHDYRDWGIPLGRRFRALKIWMTMQLLGTAAVKDRIRHHIALAADVETWIESHPVLEKAYPRSFNIVCFRIRADQDDDGARTRELCKQINDSGKAYMTHASIEGRSLIRWVTGQTYLQAFHIDSTKALVDSLLPSV
jgi:aromatic-L-amino-acid decarboxylase